MYLSSSLLGRLTNARARSCRVQTSEKRRLPLYKFDREGYKRSNVCRLDSHLLRVQTSGRMEAPLQVIELVKTGLPSLRRLMKLRKPYDYKKENWQASILIFYHIQPNRFIYGNNPFPLPTYAGLMNCPF